MTYTPDPTDATNPIGSISAGTADIEFQALKLYGQQAFTGRNLFINGAFGINQLGTTYSYGVDQAAVAGYTLDGWAYEDGFGNTTIEQYPDAVGNNELRMTSDVTTASGMYKILFQSCEAGRCNYCAEGAVITVSGYLNIPTNSGLAVTVQLNAANALNDFASITSVGTSGPLTLTAGQLTYFKTQITLSAAATYGLQVQFVFTGTGITNASTYAYKLQAEVNNFATPYEYRGYAVDLIECKRFLQIFQVGSDRLVQGPNSALIDSYASEVEMLGTVTAHGTSVSGTAPSAYSGGTSEGKTYAFVQFDITGSGTQNLVYAAKVVLDAQL